MRQSIIVGARPLMTRGKLFPVVPLEAGAWKIEVENRVTSKLVLHIFRASPQEEEILEIPFGHTEVLVLDGPVKVSGEIVEAGKEEYISVFAVPLRG